MVIPSLCGGGAERVLVLLARGFQDLGHDVDVVTIFGEADDFYRLPQGTGRVALGLGKATFSAVQKIRANLKRLSALRAALRALRPDVVVSFMGETNVLALLAALRLKVPVIVTEHVNPRKHRLPKMWEILRGVFYRRAARVVSVSEGVDAYFTWVPEAKRAVIHNPVCLDEIHCAAGETVAFDWLHTAVAMGRLEVQKGFDVLASAFAKVAPDFPEWGLVILGEGSERSNLESLVARLHMTERIRLPGALESPFATMKQADLFVLSSRYEGFGIAVVEAMACGLPVIATDCPSGPAEILRQGEDGILVPPEDVDALAGALAELMADQGKRQNLGSRGIEAARRFDLDLVSRTWDELLEAVVTARDRA